MPCLSVCRLTSRFPRAARLRASAFLQPLQLTPERRGDLDDLLLLHGLEAAPSPWLGRHLFNAGVARHRRQGVTIGNRREDGPVPVIGDNVEFGAYAQVFGGVHVGDGSKIGAMSVVLHDVPAGATVVGAPAKVVAREPAA